MHWITANSNMDHMSIETLAPMLFSLRAMTCHGSGASGSKFKESMIRAMRTTRSPRASFARRTRRNTSLSLCMTYESMKRQKYEL